MCFSQFRVCVVSGTISQNKSIRHRQIFSALQNEWLRVQKGSYTLEILSVEILTLKKKKNLKLPQKEEGQQYSKRYCCSSQILGINLGPQVETRNLNLRDIPHQQQSQSKSSCNCTLHPQLDSTDPEKCFLSFNCRQKKSK